MIAHYGKPTPIWESDSSLIAYFPACHRIPHREHRRDILERAQHPGLAEAPSGAHRTHQIVID